MAARRTRRDKQEEEEVGEWGEEEEEKGPVTGRRGGVSEEVKADLPLMDQREFRGVSE